MEPAYVGLGGNIGDVPARLRWAAGELAKLPGPAVLRLSSLWRTAPVGPVADQPPFVNAVVEIFTALGPAELLAALQEIETRAGRDRSTEIPQGPRGLDLDLLLVGAQVLDSPTLQLPHPRMHERAFALAPLVELAGADVVIPGHGAAGALLEKSVRDQQIAAI